MANAMVYTGKAYNAKWHEPFNVFHAVIEIQLLANQSSPFQNVILSLPIKGWLYCVANICIYRYCMYLILTRL